MYKGFDLTGTVALITGGNGGIGLGMARGLAEAGADIAIWGTNAEKNARAEAELKALGRNVMTRIVDVADEKAVIAGMEETVAVMGRVDSCFANSGVSGRKASFLDIDEAEYRRVMGVNLDGVFWTVREACKHMKARAEAGDPGGSIIAISSLAARSGTARNQHYGAAKHGVIGIVQAVAVEFARYDIRANAILPGWTTSELTQPLQDSETFNRKAISRVPLRRWGAPEDFAGIAIYLASKASSFHTGDAILIDGGYAMF